MRDNIYISEKIVSPAVYGIRKPKILLPASYENEDLEFIIMHEMMHIRHADNLWRILALFITVFHWFNPFSWIFLKYFLADLEHACDEYVIAALGKHRAKDYALALLNSKRTANLLSSPFGGAKIRTRIDNILSFRRITWFSLAVFTALLLVISYTLLTNGT